MTSQPSQGPDYQGPDYQRPGNHPNGSPWPGYQPPQQYGQPQYGNTQYFGQPSYYGGTVEPKTLSIASMVCGIASVIMGWLLLPQFAAIITGHLALRREPSGKGMSITGLVLGYLCLLGYGALWLLFIIGVAVAGTAGSNTGTF
ncbi:DUF4190 domain-containing protein [Arthrobacter sp. DNA4]|uniref:DUF4190 domain-containing protein n=1 Tax=Arthrobacter sp. DNA4 TaxID=2963432 RepID=UPI0020CC8148|nr:DUF4190 domain-containing protein [Arthrobacter sp. DNA4]UTT69808.1 DUF4190 domain-containing protein [Arthrobacter sp. DNA4]